MARVGLLPSPAWSLAWPAWSLEQTREEMSSLDQRKVETGWRWARREVETPLLAHSLLAGRRTGRERGGQRLEGGERR